MPRCTSHRPPPCCQCRRPERAPTADTYWWCLSPQLGKLRSFAAGSGTGLGERPGRGGLGQGGTVIPRYSPLYLVRLWCVGLSTVVWSRLDDFGPDQIAPRVSLYAETFRNDIIEGLRVSHLNRLARPPQRVALSAQREGCPIGPEAVRVDPVLPAARTDLLGRHDWHGIPAGAHSFQLFGGAYGSVQGVPLCSWAVGPRDEPGVWSFLNGREPAGN